MTDKIVTVDIGRSTWQGPESEAPGKGKAMTNYNDGKWHAWNGGECPVHPETVVKPLIVGDKLSYAIDAKDLDWHGETMFGVIAFRVIKEHKEPREFTIRYNEDKSVTLIGSPVDHFHAKPGEVIHVREVLE